MNCTVHHSCQKKGGLNKVIDQIPFLSKFEEAENKRPFLGEGYYFWDFNKDYAKVWGKNHYNNNYYVFEAEVEIDEKKDGYFLDLVGNRKHLVQFVKLLKEFELADEKGIKGIDLCEIIQLLRGIGVHDVFPYKVIRAVDYSNDEKKGVKIAFNKELESYTILNPRFILSFVNKNDIKYSKKPFCIFVS